MFKFILPGLLLLISMKKITCESAEVLAYNWKECQKEIGAAEADLIEYYNKGTGDTNKDDVKCHLKCLLEKSGMFKDGILNGDTTFEIMSQKEKYKNKEANLREAINDCKGFKGNNDCDTVAKIAKCFTSHNAINLI